MTACSGVFFLVLLKLMFNINTCQGTENEIFFHKALKGMFLFLNFSQPLR